MKFVLINKMKATKLILILALVVSCFSDECTERYEEKLKNQCASMGACSYYGGRCFSTPACSEGNPAYCESTYPPDFKKSKCVLLPGDTKCSSTPRLCNEYGTAISFGSLDFSVDDCLGLSPGTDKDRCDWDQDGGCQAYKDLCSGFEGEEDCNNNIPKDHSKICYFEDGTCKTGTRKCNDPYLRSPHSGEMNEAFCQKLDPSDPTSDKTCHSVEGLCEDIYEKCSSYTGNDESECSAIKPLKTEEGNAFTGVYKCVFNAATTPKCKSEKKKCSDYNGNIALCPTSFSRHE